MTTWVYIRTEPRLWTVGFYDPDGKWQTDSDWDVREDAARRVAYLNGGTPLYGLDEQKSTVKEQLWVALRSAQRLVDGGYDAEARAGFLATRNGLLEAYAIVTGEDPETTYERLQEERQAEAERAGGGW